MRTIIVSFLLIGIFAVAIIGSMYIFELSSGEQALRMLLKTGGALLLLGGCSVAVSLLLAASRKDSQE